jgi:hypothetical protein
VWSLGRCLSGRSGVMPDGSLLAKAAQSLWVWGGSQDSQTCLACAFGGSLLGLNLGLCVLPSGHCGSSLRVYVGAEMPLGGSPLSSHGFSEACSFAHLSLECDIHPSVRTGAGCIGVGQCGRVATTCLGGRGSTEQRLLEPTAPNF